MNTTDKLPETKSISSHQAYTEGFVQGVRFCEKYGIPANPTPLSNTKEQVPLFTTEQYNVLENILTAIIDSEMPYDVYNQLAGMGSSDKAKKLVEKIKRKLP